MTVIVPAAVPIEADEVIVALPPSALSTIVPLFNASGLAPKLNTSSAFVAAFAAPIARLNVSLLVDEPLVYASKCGPLPEPEPWFPLVTESVGVPPLVFTVTFSLNVTVADNSYNRFAYI